MLMFYVRHGDPIYSPDSLTPLGKRQAEAVAKRLALYGIDRIFASTSNRAVLTATPTSEYLKKEITQLDFCNEGHAWNYFTAKTENGDVFWASHIEKYARLFNSPEVRALGNRWYEHPEFADTMFQEGTEFINRETDKFLLELGYKHDRENGVYEALKPNNERIALFAHQGFGLAFLSSLLDISYPIFSTHFDITHTGLTVIDFGEKEGLAVPRILTLSNDSHLYREGLPTKYNGFLYF